MWGLARVFDFVHATKEYKWSYKLSPLIDSEMLLDCLETGCGCA